MSIDAFVNDVHRRIEQLICEKFGGNRRSSFTTNLKQIGNRFNPVLLAALYQWNNGRNRLVHARAEVREEELRNLGNTLILTLEGGPAIHGRCVTIQNKWSHRFVDVDHASHDDGAGVNQWAGEGSENEQWWLYQQPDYSFAIFAKHSGKCLDVNHLSLDNGGGIIQQGWGDGLNQKWWITPLDDNSYRIMSVNSGKVLDGTWGEGNWSPLTQWEWHGGDNQRWLITILE